MTVYPKGFFKRITDIDYKYLKDNNILGLILDVDNTLINYNEELSEDIINWIDMQKKNKIKMCILSNSNKVKKIQKVANKLELEYIYFAMKPFKNGFNRALRILNLKNENVAVIGDQIFTDVIGANRMKMHSILVEPIEKKDIFITVLKRPIENMIKHRYIRKKENKNVL